MRKSEKGLPREEGASTRTITHSGPFNQQTTNLFSWAWVEHAQQERCHYRFKALLINKSIPFSLPGLPVGASVGENVQSPAGTRRPRVRWYAVGGEPFLQREREEVIGGFVRVGL